MMDTIDASVGYNWYQSGKMKSAEQKHPQHPKRNEFLKQYLLLIGTPMTSIFHYLNPARDSSFECGVKSAEKAMSSPAIIVLLDKYYVSLIS
jgi:hypothetical protein